MRVLMVHNNPCIRATKECRALRAIDSKIEVFMAHGIPGADLSAFDGHRPYSDLVTLNDFAIDIKPDIIHCHNEPDKTALMALSIRTRKHRIVHDCHDMTTLRCPSRLVPEQFLDEAIVNKYSDACIYATERLEAFAVGQYAPTATRTVESRHLLSDVRISPDLSTETRLSLVWQGGLTPSLGMWGAYRYMVPMFKALEPMFDINVFTSSRRNSGNEFVEYDSLDSTTIHGSLPYDELLVECGNNHYGLVAFNADNVDHEELTYLQFAMPNKLFDYIAAGIPIITVNCGMVADFVRLYDIGIVIDKAFGPWILDEARESYKRHKRNVEACQERLSMDREIIKLRNLYEGIVHG